MVFTQLQQVIQSNRVIIACIIAIAVFLRFFRLTTIPPSLSWDEVAIGYNAYSILQTGKDEYGSSFPVLFRSFDDYKLPGMVYTSALSIALFGLNGWGVRIPSATFGVLTVLILYFLGKQIGGKRLGYIVSFLGAMNPWLINFSRQSFESNGATFFTLLLAYFLIDVTSKPRQLYWAALAGVVALYFYYSTRIVVPSIIIAYTIVERKWILKHLQLVMQAGCGALLLLIPLLLNIFSSGGFSRISQVVVTTDPLYTIRQEEYTNRIVQNQNALWARLMYNRRRALIETIVQNYFRNLNLKYMFIGGLGTSGLFLPIELISISIGIVVLIRTKKQWKWILFAWLLSYPLVGALTKDQPNSLRTLVGAPVLLICSGIGLEYGIRQIRQHKALLYFPSLLFVLFVIAAVTIQFFNAYLASFSHRAVNFGDGYKQLSRYIAWEKDRYDTIWVSGEHWRPYIHLLFHLQYPPALYQTGGTREGFGKFKFGIADWDREGVRLQTADLQLLTTGRTLFILSEKEYKFKKHEGVKFWSQIPIYGLQERVYWAVTLYTPE